MSYVSQPMRRLQDPRLLTGGGRYVDDQASDGVLHAAFLRSPHAHALITRVDVKEALALPGVHAVLTGEEVTALTRVMTTVTTFS